MEGIMGLGFLSFVLLQSSKSTTGIREKQETKTPITFEAFILGALHAQCKRVDADVVVDFEAGVQVVQRNAALEQRVPLGRTAYQYRLLLSFSNELAEPQLLKQNQPAKRGVNSLLQELRTAHELNCDLGGWMQAMRQSNETKSSFLCNSEGFVATASKMYSCEQHAE
jgi:hypothetical protein